MEFGFTHCSLQPQQKPVVEARRIVDAVFIEDQGVGKGANLQKALPVGIVARQPGDFQPHHDSGMPHADVADQPLKPLAPGRRRSGLTLIAIDDDDLLVAPAESDSAPAKPILPPGALCVLDDLPHRRLADVQVCAALKVIGPDLEVGIHDDLRSWMLVAIVART
jgi:hypothetical protein